MSEPAIFALIRDGETRYFADRWAGALLRREVLWGPDDFETWVLQFEPLDGWDGECDGGAVVDFDRRILVWNGDGSTSRVPRVSYVYRKLLSTAWPEFEIKQLADSGALVRHLPQNGDGGGTQLIVHDPGREDQASEARPQTVDEAKRHVLDEEDYDATNDNRARAWITIVDADGKTRQRELDQLPTDVLQANPEALKALTTLRVVAIPREAVVLEGLCLNPAERTLGIWGSRELFDLFQKSNQQWKDWKLSWMKRGYADQCAVAGTRGIPMSTAEAAAKVVPLMLSTQQINAEVMLGAIGGGVKRFANKAVGCLMIVLCLPLLIFGLVSGNWRAMLISMVLTVAIVWGAYRFLVARFRRAMSKRFDEGDEARMPPVAAGPVDETLRKKRVDQLLRQAGLPRLADVEPLHSGKTGLELLAEC